MRQLYNAFFGALMLSLISSQSFFGMKTTDQVPPISLTKVHYELLDAIYNNKEDVVITLLALGANPNTQSPKNWKIKWTALHYAAESGNPRIINELLKYNADVTAKNHNELTPLDIALKMNNEEAIKILQAVQTQLPRPRSRSSTTSNEQPVRNLLQKRPSKIMLDIMRGRGK